MFFFKPLYCWYNQILHAHLTNQLPEKSLPNVDVANNILIIHRKCDNIPRDEQLHIMTTLRKVV